MIDRERYGPWAVVTGGSEGIGAAMAVQLGASGIGVVLIARKPGPLAEAADQVRETGADVRTLSLDLTAPDMLARVREVTDDLDVGLLAYTAGSTRCSGPFLEWSLEDVRQIIELNVDGPTILVHHFGRAMADRGRGGIAIMGSFAGIAGSPTVVPYSGAKAYSQLFCEGLWWELKDQGVDVLHVVVGATNTPAMVRQGIVYPEEMGVGGDVVARYTLENLTNGPVFVMPQLVDAVRERTTTDRRRATEINAARIMATTSRQTTYRGER